MDSYFQAATSAKKAERQSRIRNSSLMLVKMVECGGPTPMQHGEGVDVKELLVICEGS